ncbi:24949_t:CDS:1, partial [Dentiscutata erythropus]
MPEDKLAEFVACKTKKSKKRIRVQAPSSLCKKSKRVVAKQTSIFISDSPHKLYSSVIPQDKSPLSDISQTDSKE